MRLLVHVEGETEEAFVNEVLASHLAGYGYSSVSARLVGNARQRSRRGGIRSWSSVRNEIMNHLKADRRCLATTMVDYYGLPASGNGAWPGRREAPRLLLAERAAHVERACTQDVVERAGDDVARRLVPFVMIHEFEALLFSDCRRFAEGIGRRRNLRDLQRIRDMYRTPEEINDSPDGAPSKRIEALIPSYDKPFMGTLAALEVGIDAMQAACPHFSSWLERLRSVVIG